MVVVVATFPFPDSSRGLSVLLLLLLLLSLFAVVAVVVVAVVVADVPVRRTAVIAVDGGGACFATAAFVDRWSSGGSTASNWC